MTNLKRLGAAVFLTCALGLSAFADCPLPGPGQTEGPPCVSAAQPTADSTVPAQTETSAVPESPSVDLFSLAETVLNALVLF